MESLSLDSIDHHRYLHLASIKIEAQHNSSKILKVLI